MIRTAKRYDDRTFHIPVVDCKDVTLLPLIRYFVCIHKLSNRVQNGRVHWFIVTEANRLRAIISTILPSQESRYHGIVEGPLVYSVALLLINQFDG